MVAKNPGNIAGWVGDANFQVRGALAALPDGGNQMLVRENEQAEWQILLTWVPAEDALNSAPIGFTKDGQSIYLEDSSGANAGRLVRMNIASGEKTVLASDPQCDVGGVMIQPDTLEVQAWHSRRTARIAGLRPVDHG